MCKTLSVESGIPLISHCAEANAVLASRSIERVSNAVGAKRGYVLLRVSAILKVRRERPNASQVRGVSLTGLFQDQSDYRPQVLLCSPARRHGNFYWKLKS
jgi:hypothetical protein